MTIFQNRFALIFACALITLCVSTQNAFAVPQSVEDVLPRDIDFSPCSQNETTTISIRLDSSDNDNMHLATQMEHIMIHHGYSIDITRALYRAYLKTGVDFKLLVLKAIMESDYGRYNVAAQTSARGVFQYIEPTWMVLMHRYGDKIGYGHYAKVITYNNKTKIASLKGPARHLRGEILALRHNPEVSALIKSHQIIEETDVIRGYKRGRKVTATDHYIAHMLGLYLMKDFYQLIERKSAITPARLNNPHMREAAKMNKAFFFKGQRPLSAQESYKRFQKRVKGHFKKINKMSQTNAKVIPVSTSKKSCISNTKTPKGLIPPALKVIR